MPASSMQWGTEVSPLRATDTTTSGGARAGALVALALAANLASLAGCDGGPDPRSLALTETDLAVLADALRVATFDGARAEAAAMARLIDFPVRPLSLELARRTRSGDLAIRRAASRLLRKLPAGEAWEGLLEAALGTGCPEQPAVLRRALEGSPVGAPARLREALTPRNPLSRRVHAAFALGVLRHREAVPRLVEVVQDSQEAGFLRRAALTALGQLDAGDLEGILLGLLTSEDEGLRTQAQRTLEGDFVDSPAAMDALARLRPPPKARPRPPKAARIPGGLGRWIRRAARRHRLDPQLVAAVCEIESDFKRDARSKAGAQGLMQLMPETARDMGVENPWDPRQNLLGGSRYLRKMIDRFGRLQLALAAYNAGPAAVAKHRGVPPYPETKRYIEKVMRAYRRRTVTR